MAGHMDIHPENKGELVRHDERFDEYTLSVDKPEGNVLQIIGFCPWCGEKLPASKREQWFDELEAKGINPMVDAVPDEYKTAKWRSEMS
jgi:hypothetical protein